MNARIILRPQKKKWYKVLYKRIKDNIQDFKFFVKFRIIKPYNNERNLAIINGEYGLWVAAHLVFILLIIKNVIYYFFIFSGINLVSLKETLKFVDSVSVYGFSLVSLHHDVMWYIFFVLGVVCWSIFGIIRDYCWRKSSLKVSLPGVSLFSFNSILLVYIESFFLFLFFRISSFVSKYFLYFFSKNLEVIEEHFLYIYYFFVSLSKEKNLELREKSNSNFATFLKSTKLSFLQSTFFISAKSFFEINKLSTSILNLTFKQIFDLLLNKKIDVSLYEFTNKADFYSDDYSRLVNEHFFKHSTFLELLWAGFPLTIIGYILLPSLILLYSLDEELDPSFTVKVIGHQWYWSYEFYGWIRTTDKQFRLVEDKFDSSLILEDDLTLGSKRLLEVDNRLILPLNTILRFVITSGDVLHSWSVPEAGIKVDAVPGRLNQMVTWFVRPGSFFGQCSELCGIGHGFMPIVIEVISYDPWVSYVNKKKSLHNDTKLIKHFSGVPEPDPRVSFNYFNEDDIKEIFDELQRNKPRGQNGYNDRGAVLTSDGIFCQPSNPCINTLYEGWFTSEIALDFLNPDFSYSKCKCPEEIAKFVIGMSDCEIRELISGKKNDFNSMTGAFDSFKRHFEHLDIFEVGYGWTSLVYECHARCLIDRAQVKFLLGLLNTEIAIQTENFLSSTSFDSDIEPWFEKCDKLRQFYTYKELIRTTIPGLAWDHCC